MTINDFPPSSQAFVVTTSSNTDADREVASISQNDQSLTQAFTIPQHHSNRFQFVILLHRHSILKFVNLNQFHLLLINLIQIWTFNLHLHEFQVDLEHYSKVTSNDVQQMLLTGALSIDEEQPMEENNNNDQHFRCLHPLNQLKSKIIKLCNGLCLFSGYAAFN